MVTYVHEWAQQSGDAPEEDACSHDSFATVSVAEVAKQRCENHVAYHERCLQ